MTAKNSWLEVDIRGLAKIIEDRPKERAIFELIQNAWDETSKNVTVTMRMVARGTAQIEVVDDNPDGFTDLSHAYTLYAESKKKDDPTKRGRFNSGEKFVLALCDSAEIVTTTGAVVFEPDGTRRGSRKRTETGSRFSAVMRMRQTDLTAIEQAVHTLFVPADIVTSVNGVQLTTRVPVATFTASLPTVVADAQGVLRERIRQTEVRVYEPRDGEVPTVYEVGIPVVETANDRYHVDVQQRVPLGQDRDSLSPKFLRTLHTVVLNATYNLIKDDAVTASWVNDALGSADVVPEAVRAVVTERFGDLVASYSPTDLEANQRAADHGYTIVHGRSLPAAVWENVRHAEAILPASKLFPTGNGIGGGSPDGTLPPAIVEQVPEAEFSADMHMVVRMAKAVAGHVTGRTIDVQIVRCSKYDCCIADYDANRGQLRFNLTTLGPTYFSASNLARQLNDVIHETAHDRVSNHMSEAFYHECTRVGGIVATLALAQPEIFKAYRVATRTAA